MSTDTTLAKLLIRHKEVAERLNAATQKLNDALECAEQAISELRLGESGSVLMFRESNGLEHRLGFGKGKKRHWWLTYEKRNQETGDLDIVLLRDAPREIRREAADHLEALVIHLMERAEEATEAAESKTDQINTFIKKLDRLKTEEQR